MLIARGLPTTKRVVKAITTETNATKLDRWLCLAATVNATSEMFAARKAKKR